MDKGTIVCKFSNDAMHKNLKKGARKKKLANLQNYDTRINFFTINNNKQVVNIPPADTVQ